MVTPLDLFEVLESGLIVVFASRDNGLVFTWNQSLTLSVWTVGEDGRLSEADNQTLSSVPPSIERVRHLCEQWLLWLRTLEDF